MSTRLKVLPKLIICLVVIAVLAVLLKPLFNSVPKNEQTSEQKKKQEQAAKNWFWFISIL